MECYCGCGLRVSRRLTDANLRISELALELLAWDKRRVTGPMAPEDFVETERLIDRGANAHRRLLATLHGESDAVPLEEGAKWLTESREAWHDREEMTEGGRFLRGPKLRLTKDDIARIDRVHPERSFSAERSFSTSPAARFELPDARDQGPDPAAQLQRLRSLRAEGVLTEDEFRAAEARLGE